MKNGFKRPRLEWLYALLLVVKKPLLQDVIASLRHFTRECQKRRAKLQEDEAAKIRELSLFVAIISVYFGQKDLGDPEVKWWDGDRERLLMDTELKEYMTVMAES